MAKTDKTKITAYLKKHEQWVGIFAQARKTLIAAGLEETMKWGMPAYTYEGRNLVSIAGFKNHCALWFHNGAFLKDPDKRLVNAQEGKTKGLRQWRFESGDKLSIRALKSFIKQSIDNQQAGKTIKPTKKPLSISDELVKAMKKKAGLRKAFESLTPGKQREYAEHVGSARQEATRRRRLEKVIPMIEAGVGLHDKYKNC